MTNKPEIKSLLRSAMLFLTMIFATHSFGQINITAGFDSGNIGSYSLVDSIWLHRGGNDSLQVVSVDVFPRMDPANPVDTALVPSSRWYHFRMEGVKDKLVVLRIGGSEVVRPFYSRDGVSYRRFPAEGNYPPGSLSGLFTCDTVYVAYFIPYTYARHREKIARWSRLDCVRHKVIGRSSMGLPVDMLTITDSGYGDEGKKTVWIHARIHPSEAPCSWHLEALIDRLVADTPFAAELRREAVFHVVPMANPDGVAGGYSRSSSTGVNLEINWNRPDSLTMPEVAALKGAIDSISQHHPLDLLLNLHSQVANSVTYWIHTASSSDTANCRREELLSALTMSHSPYYRPADRCYSTLGGRYAEGWMWSRTGGRTTAITFETPYTCYNEDIDGEWVSVENLGHLAGATILAVSDFLDLGKSCRVIADPAESARSNGRWHVKKAGNEIVFGDYYLMAKHKGAPLRVVFRGLGKGGYTLYRWGSDALPDAGMDVTNTVQSSGGAVNRWQEAGRITIRRPGRFVWKYRATSPGDRVDALMLVKTQ